MALFHRATVTPTKAELIAAWAPSQRWGPPTEASIDVVGAFRFDDPDGLIGMETHLVRAGDTLMQVPLTYRSEPLAGGDDALAGTTEHSVLGKRWVYDGLGDDRYLVMLAAVAMTGQGEALGMAVYDGRWYVAPANVRIVGGGWTQERVPVDGFERVAGDEPTVLFRNDGFELRFFRRPTPGPRPLWVWPRRGTARPNRWCSRRSHGTTKPRRRWDEPTRTPRAGHRHGIIVV